MSPKLFALQPDEYDPKRPLILTVTSARQVFGGAMKFELSKRLKTQKPMLPVLTLIEHTLRGVTSKVKRDGPIIEATGIVASFGSINRSDRTSIRLLKKEDGYLCVANVTYRPSVVFWILFILGFPLFSVIPVFFYLMQKSQVQEAIEATLNRVSDEFDDDVPTLQPERNSVETEIAALEKLAKLRDSGVITDAEFLAKKKKILG